MNPKLRQLNVSAYLFVALSLVFSLGMPPAAQSRVAQKKTEPPLSASEKQTINAFEQRVKEYVKLREQVKSKVPPLSKDSTPEQIQASEKAFIEALRVARAGAKPADLFSPDIASYIRTMLKTEFKPSDKKEIRKIVLETNTKGVPLRVNFPYPDPKEFTEVPPTVLLKLPQLPKQVKYRYVGQNLILVDTDNNLIIDYMLDALP